MDSLSWGGKIEQDLLTDSLRGKSLYTIYLYQTLVKTYKLWNSVFLCPFSEQNVLEWAVNYLSIFFYAYSLHNQIPVVLCPTVPLKWLLATSPMVSISTAKGFIFYFCLARSPPASGLVSPVFFFKDFPPVGSQTKHSLGWIYCPCF